MSKQKFLTFEEIWQQAFSGNLVNVLRVTDLLIYLQVILLLLNIYLRLNTDISHILKGLRLSNRENVMLI